MQTKTIDGVEPLALDQKILALIDKEADPFGPGIGVAILGIRNTSGEIYRRIEAVGVKETFGIINGLEALGFINEMTGYDAAPVERCNGVFSLKI